jgi:hypothetical protein
LHPIGLFKSRQGSRLLSISPATWSSTLLCQYVMRNLGENQDIGLNHAQDDGDRDLCANVDPFCTPECRESTAGSNLPLESGFRGSRHYISHRMSDSVQHLPKIMLHRFLTLVSNRNGAGIVVGLVAITCIASVRQPSSGPELIKGLLAASIQFMIGHKMRRIYPIRSAETQSAIGFGRRAVDIWRPLREAWSWM